MSQLAPFRRRIDRAMFISKTLHRQVLDYFVQVHPQRILIEPDPDRECVGNIFMEPPDELPSDWSLMLGEFLHEVRAALDNLTWFLAEAHSGPAPYPIPRGDRWRKVQFPVYEMTEFDNAVRRWRCLIHEDDWAILKSVQPTSTQNKGSWARTIAELSNADKHRAVHLLAMYHVTLVNPAVRVTRCEDAEVVSIELPQHTGVCRGKAKLGEVTIRPTGPNPKVEMSEQFTFEVAIDHPHFWRPFEAALITGRILSSANEIVDKFSTRYP